AQVGVLVAAGLAGLLWLPQASHEAHEALPIAMSRRAGAVWLLLFVILLAGLPLAAGAFSSHALQVADAFYRAGSLVFGGGHVVLPLLRGEVVPPGWVDNGVFLAGCGAAQAVPGPLFTFAAFLGASLQGAPSGWLGGMLCLAAIFAPSFLLVAGALPFWEPLRRDRRARAALAGINAAVVGLLLAALYQPVWTSAILGPADFALALLALAALTAWKLPPWLVVAGCAALGALLPGLAPGAPPPGRAAGEPGGSGRAGRRAPRESQARAQPRVGIRQFQAPAVQAGDRHDGRQAQAVTGHMAVRAIEALADAVQLLRRDARPVVGHRQRALARCPRGLDADARALPGTLEGSLPQGGDGAGQQVGIAMQRRGAGRLERQRGLVVLGDRLVQVGHIARDHIQAHRFEVLAPRAGLQLGDLQQFLRNLDQVLQLGRQAVDRLAYLLARFRFPVDGAQARQHARQRRAQMVRHGVRDIAHPAHQQFDAIQHAVDIAGQQRELVLARMRRDALAQFA